MNPHDLFFYAKGVVALVAALLLIHHMNSEWAHIRTLGRRMRYLCLLGYVALTAAASPEQAAEGLKVQARNVTSLLLSLFVIATVVVSIRGEADDHPEEAP